jgi:UV DNA damage endonuclease
MLRIGHRRALLPVTRPSLAIICTRVYRPRASYCTNSLEPRAMSKRKRQSSPAVVSTSKSDIPQIQKRRSSTRNSGQAAPIPVDPNPDTNALIRDGEGALRASPDEEPTKPTKATKRKKNTDESAEQIIKQEDSAPELKTQKPTVATEPTPSDPEAGEEEDASPEELTQALARPPPVNSSYLPLPWKGRLGYACLNTYLRAANPPVFSSRTCRIASILEHRHPLKDPSQPEHATKNRPDKDQPADIARGQAYVEALGLANARDIVKMLRWNDRFGIKFLRLSSEMFPFASHDVYGYKLTPFASEVLAEAGRVAAELGHRLTTHPGQFTQLGSPRQAVIDGSFRDLDYHCELLDLLKLPPQQDRDAVMILHMGGVFGDKSATIERFRENYARLSDSVKRRLVLENDDVCYTVHDLLPVCEELNIPLVLDYHHHNILFDADKIREGTLDIMNLYDRIRATWTRKGITQKMHYSEQTPAAITARQRRKHNPRVASLPPCVPDMDLMIEAKDKEQAVFELMRTFRLPGFETFNDMQPHIRTDENKPWKPPKKKTPKNKKAGVEPEEEVEAVPPPLIPEDEVSMGGPQGRVYWPPGMEHWLRPKKREVKPKDPAKAKSTAEKAAEKRAEKAAWQAAREASAERDREATASISAVDSVNGETPAKDLEATKSVYNKTKKSKPVRAPKSSKKAKTAPTPSASSAEDDLDEEMDFEESPAASPVLPAKRARPAQGSRRQSGRAVKKPVDYVDGDD